MESSPRGKYESEEHDPQCRYLGIHTYLQTARTSLDTLLLMGCAQVSVSAPMVRQLEVLGMHFAFIHTSAHGGVAIRRSVLSGRRLPVKASKKTSAVL